MKDFTRGISNHAGPDPNRIFNGYRGASNGESKKKDKKVGICPSKEETLAFSNDVLKFIQKRLNPGAGVVIAAGVSPVGLPIIKMGIGRVENITMECEFNSDNPFVDLGVCMPQARFVMDISSDDESGKP